MRTAAPRQPAAWLDSIPLDATEIDIIDGSVSEIPARIVRYAEITTIQLAYNKLVRLPAELCRLAKLTSLDLRYNRLATLPEELGQLASLSWSWKEMRASPRFRARCATSRA